MARHVERGGLIGLARDTRPRRGGRCRPDHLAVDGVAELAAVAVAASHRRRGIATGVSAFLTGAAFERGAGLVWLEAAGPGEQQVYERVGYHLIGEKLYLFPPLTPQPCPAPCPARAPRARAPARAIMTFTSPEFGLTAQAGRPSSRNVMIDKVPPGRGGAGQRAGGAGRGQRGRGGRGSAGGRGGGSAGGAARAGQRGRGSAGQSVWASRPKRTASSRASQTPRRRCRARRRWSTRGVRRWSRSAPG